MKKADSGPLLIECFEDAEGKQYIFPVNRSFKAKVKAKLTLDPKTVSVSEISQKTGKTLEANPPAAGVLDVPLEAGEGRLFLLNKKQ